MSATLRDPPALEARAIQAYRARQDAAAPVALGVITNPFSRTNARSRLYDRLLPDALPDPAASLTTHTLAEFDAALRVLLLERHVNVLGLNGGDGTLHLGVNRLLALQQAVLAETGEALPLPRLLFLNGGTLNVVSRATGTQGNPLRTVREFVRASAGRSLGVLDTRRVRLLAVSAGDAPVRYGFIFGTEVVANALEMYTLFGEGYVGLGRMLSEVGLGYTVGTRLWREHGWKLDATRRPIAVDGEEHRRNLAAVACTIELSLVKGLITAIRPPGEGRGFAVRLLTETHPGRVIRSIPALMVGAPVPGVLDRTDAHELVSYGGYTLDGELFLDRSPEGMRRRVVVRAADVAVQAVRLRSAG